MLWLLPRWFVWSWLPRLSCTWFIPSGCVPSRRALTMLSVVMPVRFSIEAYRASSRIFMIENKNEQWSFNKRKLKSTAQNRTRDPKNGCWNPWYSLQCTAVEAGVPSIVHSIGKSFGNNSLHYLGEGWYVWCRAKYRTQHERTARWKHIEQE